MVDGMSKARRKELALKKAKQKKRLAAGLCALAAVVVLTFVTLSVIRQSGAETYSGGGQTVQLFTDGKFSANLGHNQYKSGSYTKTAEDGRVMVTFHVNGVTAEGWIENNRLHIPEEWDDGCGHGSILPRK
jgi:hypothetical protein